jgi:LPXTG-motif cell wall-anchored protein
MRKTLLLLALAAVIVLAFASPALAQLPPTGGQLPTTGGPALVPVVFGLLSVGLGLSTMAYLRRRRR